MLFCTIVEDEPLAQRVLENYILRIKDLSLVAKCETIADALKVISENKVDIVFLDLNLNTVNGIDMIHGLRDYPSNRYYIVITSAASQDDLDVESVFKQKNIHYVDYLTKPFSFERFNDAVQKIIGAEGK